MVGMKTTTGKGEVTMTKEDFERDHPKAIAEWYAAERAVFEAERATGFTERREDLRAIRAEAWLTQCEMGHEARRLGYLDQDECAV